MAFQQGLSGLNSASTHLDVISRNIANTNTVGYKSGTTEFADVFANTGGGATGGLEVGIGAQVLGVSKHFKQGSLTSSGNPLDVAINGEGFFKINDDGSYAYSRNGQFHLDKNGYLNTNTDLLVRGYVNAKLDVSGNVLGFDSEGDIRVDFSPLAAVATTEIRLGLNLDERAVIPTEAFPTGTVPVGGIPTSAYNHTRTLSVYDSAGTKHDLTMYFAKTAPNTWNVYATADQADGSAIYDYGEVTFNADGSFATPATGSLALASGIDVDTADTDVDLLNVSLILNDSTSSDSLLTQYSNSFGVHLEAINGQSSGELTSLSISQTGVLTGTYSNGKTRQIAQLMLVSFRNPQGLVSLGANQWGATDESGSEIPNKPGEGVVGLVSSGSVEDSNVDLTGELVNLIIAQRLYQANAQSVKTQSDLLQVLVNIN